MTRKAVKTKMADLLLRFSFIDIFNISQLKNTKVSLITQQYDGIVAIGFNDLSFYSEK